MILPEEYGGTSGKLDISAWNELLLASEEDLLHDFSQLVLPGDSLPCETLVSGDADEKQCDESLRGMKPQLYYCY